MRIMIVTEACEPQINGVVRTLQNTIEVVRKLGHEVLVVTPDPTSWRTWPAPIDPTIKLEFFGRPRLEQAIQDFNPDCIHIATEGPLGWSARNACLHLKKPFTSSYHTRYPEYFEEHWVWPLSTMMKLAAYIVLRRFHRPSAAMMVATPSIEKEMQKKRFRNIVRWERGVDMDLFKPYGKDIAAYENLQRPILLYVGRVVPEKNLESFLGAKTKGTKVVIGDGTARAGLQKQFPDAVFLGAKEGEDLARHYAAADLFVFPSKTDTFGLVLLEAAASGLRIASYPAPGPADIFGAPEAGRFVVLDHDLGQAIANALQLPDNQDSPRHYAGGFSWGRSTLQFVDHLQAQTPMAVRRMAKMGNAMRRTVQRIGQRALALKIK